MNRAKMLRETEKKARPVPAVCFRDSGASSKAYIIDSNTNATQLNYIQAKDDNLEAVASQEIDEETKNQQKAEIERFIEISKYFSNPLRKTASYICEHNLVSYPNPYRVEYKRGGITTQHLKFSNLILEPVYIKLYKLIPDLEQVKYINLSLARSKRIPPGLSFTLGFVYDDVNEKPSTNAKMVFVASRKTTTPCYQICEIELQINAQKIRQILT